MGVEPKREDPPKKKRFDERHPFLSGFIAGLGGPESSRQFLHARESRITREANTLREAQQQEQLLRLERLRSDNALERIRTMDELRRAAKEEEDYTLGPGQQRFRKDLPVASVPPNPREGGEDTDAEIRKRADALRKRLLDLTEDENKLNQEIAQAQAEGRKTEIPPMEQQLRAIREEKRRFGKQPGGYNYTMPREAETMTETERAQRHMEGLRGNPRAQPAPAAPGQGAAPQAAPADYVQRPAPSPTPRLEDFPPGYFTDEELAMLEDPALTEEERDYILRELLAERQ